MFLSKMQYSASIHVKEGSNTKTIFILTKLKKSTMLVSLKPI